MTTAGMADRHLDALWRASPAGLTMAEPAFVGLSRAGHGFRGRSSGLQTNHEGP